MYPAPFNFMRVGSFSEASAVLAADPNAKAIAGGQTLIPMMKLRLLKPALLVDLRGISGARDIALGDAAVEIGALATHVDIAGSDVAERFSILRDCGQGIADTQVRNMGTIGGSLAEADPCSCWPALLVALDAQVLCEGPDSQRVQGVRELLEDAYTPALEPGELITRVAIARQALEGYGTFVAFKRCAPAYPTASCAMQIAYDGDRIASLRMGFGCLGLTALAFDEGNDIAAGRQVTENLVDEVAEAASIFVEPFADSKGTEEYKRELTRGLVKRAFGIIEARRLGRPAVETHQYYG
ncbi:FAD binding domain-containing protein [Mesorhizobium sp.]|uniref:FAD binding domain-containing protein n=1 Tax=Mesorhizobium sp. TaxID=1871066 RepID=UPI000FE88219|nr:FAD binding domain-containing protein [Mesorhizobium sp.]RWA57929.1 MAG: carbon monoxide dehydrogenase [Mesorhizobium sp.]